MTGFATNKRCKKKLREKKKILPLIKDVKKLQENSKGFDTNRRCKN